MLLNFIRKNDTYCKDKSFLQFVSLLGMDVVTAQELARNRRNESDFRCVHVSAQTPLESQNSNGQHVSLIPQHLYLPNEFRKRF